jgi:HK97 family phage portal protein
MGLGAAVRQAWDRVIGVAAAGASGERETVVAPLAPFVMSSLFSPSGKGRWGGGGQTALPKPTIENLRRFAETPVARRAINCIKDRIACMEWRIEPRPGAAPKRYATQRTATLTRALESPNESDSFRTLIEQVIEDVLVGGFGAAEIERSDGPLPVRLYAVDGASIQVNAQWNGDPATPRYAQVSTRWGRQAMMPAGGSESIPLRDDQLMYVRLNPRSHTVFGLGKVEVAFEAISSFLQAHRYAGRMASHSVVQYALWMNERTPEQHERLIRWWQDEVEGTGRVPVLSSEQKPEVLRFAGGTDADLHLQWQQFLLTMIANAFDLPAMLLGVVQDVNRSTATEFANEAFQSAVVPLAKLLAEHITRDVIVKKLGWSDLRFVWCDLESRDEAVEVDIQTKLLAAGVLSVAEVRAMRGLPVERDDAANNNHGGAREAGSAEVQGPSDAGDGVGDSGGDGAPEPAAV